MARAVGGVTGLGVVLLVTAVGSLGVGAVHIPPAQVAGVFREWLGNESPADPLARTIILDLRLPRVLLAVAVGAALAAAGVAFQGLFRNPLADPFVVGASSGAALGATAAIVAGWRAGLLGLGGEAAAGFAGAMAAAGVVLATGSWGGRTPVAALLLAGAAVSSFCSSLVWLLMFFSNRDLARIVAYLMGSFSTRDWPDLAAAAPSLLVGCAGLWLLARPLDALAAGEDTARALGLRVGVTTVAVVGFASLAVAGAVGVAGIIGFVGLVAPHAARFLVGPRHALLFPASALVGAELLLVADTAARVVVAPLELPVGILTALLGGPFFLLVLRRNLVRDGRPGRLGGAP